MLSLHIRNFNSLYCQVNFKNANNTGGYMILEKGQLFRYTDTKKTFVITSVEKILQPIAGHHWYVDIFVDGVVKNMRKRDFDLALELGKIELVK